MNEILLLDALDSSGDDLEEDVALHTLHEEEKVGNRAVFYGRFNFNDLCESETKRLFWFQKNDIEVVVGALGLLGQIGTSERLSVSRNCYCKHNFVYNF